MDWTRPEELCWVGKYGADAFKIFLERRWREVQPNDYALAWWVEWMRGTQSEVGRSDDIVTTVAEGTTHGEA